MGSSPLGSRRGILALLVGFAALQVFTTIRKSLRLTTTLANDGTNPDSDLVVPVRAPWHEQARNKTANSSNSSSSSIEHPPTDDRRNNQDADNGKNRIAKFDTAPQTTITSPNATEEQFNTTVGRAAKSNTAGTPPTASRTATAEIPTTTVGAATKVDWPKMWTTHWMDDCPHFFSHIPKSGAEYAHVELIHLVHSTIRLPDNRSIFSVREAQRRFNDTGYEGDFLKSKPEYEHKYLPIPVDTTGATDGYTPPFMCNQGTTEFRHLKPYHVARGTRYKCAFWVTEQHWNPAAHNVYTLVREPFAHVLSQYFHCTESRDHKRTTGNRPNVENRHDLMPPLEEWMKIYTDLMDSEYSKDEFTRETRRLKRRFSCYTPIESESEYTKFNHRLPLDYTYPYPYTDDHGDRDQPTKELDKMLFDDLKQKYRVIGDTSQMVKSICAIFIAYTEGKHIPETCDCTKPRVGDSNSSQFYVHDLYKDPNMKKEDNLRFKIKMGFNPIHHSHGVKNHGSAFLKELSQDQLDLLAKLRKKDLVLYNVSRAVFAEQIKEMEATYGIKVCDQWNRPKQPDQSELQ